MLYDPPEGNNTPFIPPLPSPESVHPPTVPPPNHQELAPPVWAHQPRTPAHYPYYPSTPYNTTPFIPTMPSMHNTPAMQPRVDPPGSYYPAPTALPNVYANPAPASHGVSADYSGYPAVHGTPWAPPAGAPPPQAWPPHPPPPPPHPAATAYNTFQQPLPGGPPGLGGWGPPMGYATPAATPWAMPMAPPGMTPYAFPAATPWMPPTNPPPPTAPAGDSTRANIRWTSNVDRIDPFAEGPHYGPVLEPFLARVVGATVKVNPLLAPPTDTQEDYLRWNMLFHTSNCYRTTESRRSWIKGRKSPATHPRLTYVRVISRTFPWMIHIRAQDKAIGVTCGEILEGIAAYLNGDVAKKEYETVDRSKRRDIWSAYQHNRSTDPNVPGGGLGEPLKRLDWLGHETRFGGLVVNEQFVAAHCGDVLPATFELKCTHSYPLTPQEMHEQQMRQQVTVQSRDRSLQRSSRSRAGSVSERRSAVSEEVGEDEDEEYEYEEGEEVEGH